jgi:predicted transposase YdaD
MIYLTRSVDPGDHPHYSVLLHSLQVSRVYLDEWARSPQTLSQRLIHLLLASTPQAAISEAQSLLAQPIDRGLETLILDLIETILVYKYPHSRSRRSKPCWA